METATSYDKSSRSVNHDLDSQTNGVSLNRRFSQPAGFPSFLRSIRRALHAYPERGYQEKRTSHYLRTLLESHGLETSPPLATTGFYADIVGDLPGPSIGYRADMDGLPIQDLKNVPYASQHEGLTHACGHDVHMAIGVGVALTLNKARHELHGTVRIFFQPNEESDPSGSVPMIEDGVLKGLEAVYAVHVDPTIDSGQFGLVDGVVTAACDRMKVRLTQPSTGHSARPHKVKDLIWIATQLLQQLYQLMGRITDARNPAVLTICMFNAGSTHNVIPSEVAFEGGMRFLNEEDRDFVKEFVVRLVKQFAVIHAVNIELVFCSGLPMVINDSRMVQLVENVAQSLFSESAIVHISVPSMGSEDFANYLEHVPGLLLRVGTRSGERTSYPLHDANFDVDENSMAPTAQLMSTVLVEHLRQRVLQQAP